MALYDSPQHLPAALETLSAQTFAQFAVVVVDDASPEESAGAARRHAAHDARFAYVRNPRRLGMTANWGRCVQVARERHPDAPYFAWASDHDV